MHAFITLPYAIDIANQRKYTLCRATRAQLKRVGQLQCVKFRPYLLSGCRSTAFSVMSSLLKQVKRPRHFHKCVTYKVEKSQETGCNKHLDDSAKKADSDSCRFHSGRSLPQNVCQAITHHSFHCSCQHHLFLHFNCKTLRKA